MLEAITPEEAIESEIAAKEKSDLLAITASCRDVSYFLSNGERVFYALFSESGYEHYNKFRTKRRRLVRKAEYLELAVCDHFRNAGWRVEKMTRPHKLFFWRKVEYFQFSVV